jgi:hypothetical protein
MALMWRRYRPPTNLLSFATIFSSNLPLEGMLMGTDTPGGGSVQEMTLFSPGPSIYGGTDQVQRNIIGERVLGLPKEPGAPKDTPFRELLVNT